jgi:hypothetical protein
VSFTFSSFVTFFNSLKGGMSFFKKENFTLERGRRVWVYLFTIYFLKFYYYLYSFVTFFNS